MSYLEHTEEDAYNAERAFGDMADAFEQMEKDGTHPWRNPEPGDRVNIAFRKTEDWHSPHVVYNALVKDVITKYGTTVYQIHVDEQTTVPPGQHRPATSGYYTHGAWVFEIL